MHVFQALCGFYDAGSLNLQSDPAVYFTLETSFHIYGVSKSVDKFSALPYSRFFGAVIDGGAEKSVIGFPQAHLYCKFAGIPFRPLRSTNSFRFGDVISPSLGTLHIIVPLSNKSLFLQIDVVDAQVPLLLGLNKMDL